MVRAGIIPADWPVTVNAVSGYSGGGKAMVAEFESGGTDTAFRAYALGLAHKHVGEMQAHAGLVHPPLFAPGRRTRPTAGWWSRCRCRSTPFPAVRRSRRARMLCSEAYRGLPPGPRARRRRRDRGDRGRCRHRPADAARVFGNPATGQARLVATLDNLGKGAGGAAVQNLNVMAGLDPVAGLIV